MRPISKPRFDYTTVGHVTADVKPDGSRRPGGSAFYSALQAARLGQRTLIVTRGNVREIERLLDPFRGEFELLISPSARTTTLETYGSGAARGQRLVAWAGPIGEDVTVQTSILHLAPVVRETPRRWRGHADFVGLTPQGLVREWAQDTGEIALAQLDAASDDPPRGCSALVMSRAERASAGTLVAKSREVGAVVAITAGAAATTVLIPSGETLHVAVPALEEPRDDLGAGDVFAAAFFVALAEGRPPGRAAAFATAAAAVRIAGAGAEAIGETSAIEARLRAAA
jgi:hypothetical protein